MENKAVDWQKLYDAFDGHMPECDGKNCSVSCCREKITPAYGKGSVSFRTVLVDREEEKILQEHLSQNKISVQCEDTGIDSARYSLLVRDCLGDSCKLDNMKPFACRIFPFRLNSFGEALDTRCPKSFEIARNETIVSTILKIRTILGYTDNNDWERRLRRQLFF